MSESFHLLLFFGTPAALGIALGYLTGGRFRNITPVPLGAAWLVIAAGIIQIVTYRHVGNIPLPAALTGHPAAVLVFILGVSGLIWAVASRDDWPSRIALGTLAVGAGLNALVIGINGGMPSTSTAQTAAGFPPGAAEAAVESGRYLPLDTGHLIFLGDVIGIRQIQAAISIGDILIVLGIVAFFIVEMRSRPKAASR